MFVVTCFMGSGKKRHVVVAWVTVHGVQNAKTVGKPHFSDHKSSHFAAFSRRSPAAIAKTPMFFGGNPVNGYAELSVNEGSGVTGPIAFHAQQAVEKYFKALLA